MKDVVVGRCARMSSSSQSNRETPSIRRGKMDGNVDAFLMTEMTWVIPRLAGWTTSLAVARHVRYNRGAILLATLLASLFLGAEQPRPTSSFWCDLLDSRVF